MKTIFRLLCGWMAIALAACTGDELQQIEPLQKPVAQKTISVKAYTPSEQAATRLAFTEENDGSLSLAWSADDAFTAVIGGEKVTFTYNESSKEFTANVNESVTLTDGIVAYYPAYDGENFEKDFSIQTGTLNSATIYMEGVYEGDAFKFTHSTAILKATFSYLPQDATISSVGIDVVAGENSFQIAISQPANVLYINLPAIAKDGKLTFDVRTSDGTLYTATKTVTAVKGIETGVYYNTIVALSPAPVCSLLTGGEFNEAVKKFLDKNSSLTKIKFIANSDPWESELTPTKIDGCEAYMVPDSDNETLEIHTSAAEFVFNANCYGMFIGLSTITAIDFNNCVNTSKVTTMYAMFSDCPLLESLDLSSFNTAKVTDMAYMFYDCSALTSLDLSSFNTANVTNMGSMFSDCQKLTSLNVSSFNTANVANMGSMFSDCQKLTSLDLSSFNTANVTNMANMFSDCSALSSLDLSSFDFNGVENRGDVQSFSQMFYCLGESAAHRPIPVYVTLAGYNVLSKKSMTGIDDSYAQLVALCELPTGNSFNSAVKPFLSSKSLTKINFVTNSDNTDENNQIGTSGAYMVADSDNETLEIHTSAAQFMFNEDCSSMFSGLSEITAIDFNDCVNTSNVTDMKYMFNDCSLLTSLDLSSFNTEKVTNMGSMFRGCSSLESLDLRSFNTSKVTNMNFMFYYCSSLQSITFGNSFNTANVTDMSYMFSHCPAFTSLDLSSFNTANVTNMTYMFRLCSALTSLNVSNFNTEKVTDMSNMFVGCFSLESLDLSSFDFGKVANFSGMFTDLGKSVNPHHLVYIYVKDVNDKQKLDNANTDISKSRVIISVKQP